MFFSFQTFQFDTLLWTLIITLVMATGYNSISSRHRRPDIQSTRSKQKCVSVKRSTIDRISQTCFPMYYSYVLRCLRTCCFCEMKKRVQFDLQHIRTTTYAYVLFPTGLGPKLVTVDCKQASSILLLWHLFWEREKCMYVRGHTTQCFHLNIVWVELSGKRELLKDTDSAKNAPKVCKRTLLHE